MGNKTQHGYLFMFQVLFRPALMCIGFVMMALVMEVIGQFFFNTYPLAVSDGGIKGGVIDLIGYVVIIFVFFTTSVMIVNTSVNLIHLVPDTVLTWIGVQPNGSTDPGKNVSGNFTQSAVLVTDMGKNIGRAGMISGEGDVKAQAKGFSERRKAAKTPGAPTAVETQGAAEHVLGSTSKGKTK